MFKCFVLATVLLVAWSSISSSSLVDIDYDEEIFEDNSCEIQKSTSHHHVPWLHYKCKEKRVPDHAHFPAWHKKANDARLRFKQCDSMETVDVAEMEKLLLEDGGGHLQGLDLEDCTGNVDEFLTKFPEVRNLTLERAVIKEPLPCTKLDWFDYVDFTLVYAGMFTKTTVLRDVYFVTNQTAVIEEQTFVPLANVLAIVNITGEAINFPLTLLQGLVKLDTLTVKNDIIEVDELPVSVFGTLTSLRVFNFQIKRIDKISDDVFANSPLLSVVNLASNGIRVIAANAFAHLTNLRELILENNHLTTLPVINGLVHLTTLNLGQNTVDFSNFVSNPFEGLTLLQTLNLKKNPVGNLPFSWFRNNTFLREVNLTGSTLNQLDINELPLVDRDEQFFNLKEMGIIKDKTGNWRDTVLEYFPGADLPYDEEEIDIERIPLEWLQPKRTVFDFASAQIGEVIQQKGRLIDKFLTPFTDFTPFWLKGFRYNRDRCVKAYNSNYEARERVRYFECGPFGEPCPEPYECRYKKFFTNIRSENLFTLDYMRPEYDIEDGDGSDVRFECWPNFEDFAGFPEEIRVNSSAIISIDDCSVEKNIINRVTGWFFTKGQYLENLIIKPHWEDYPAGYPDNFFESVTHLKYLEFRGAMPKKFSQNLLKPLTNLESFLSIRFLDGDLSPDFFANNRKLQKVHFSTDDDFNLTIPATIFKGLVSLRFATIQGPITIFHTIFDGLTDLTEIEISNGFLEEIPEFMFKDQAKLKTLTLRYNKIKKISETAFSNLAFLETLDLEHNQLETLPEGLFRNNHRLWYSDFSSNRLTFVTNLIFPVPNRISNVHLENNRIEHLNANFFQPLKNLQDFNIANNSLVEFSFAWLKDKPFLQNINLKGNQIGEIDLNQLSIINIGDQDIVNLKELGVIDDQITNVTDFVRNFFFSLDYNATYDFERIPLHFIRNDWIHIDYNHTKIHNIRYPTELMGKVTTDRVVRWTLMFEPDQEACQYRGNTSEKFQNFMMFDRCGWKGTPCPENYICEAVGDHYYHMQRENQFDFYYNRTIPDDPLSEVKFRMSCGDGPVDLSVIPRFNIQQKHKIIFQGNYLGLLDPRKLREIILAPDTTYQNIIFDELYVRDFNKSYFSTFFEDIHNLTITNSRFKFIHEDVFTPLTKLTLLEFFGITTDLPENIFANNKMLKTLTLTNDGLRALYLPANLINGLAHLVYFGTEGLIRIPATFFHGIVSLLELDLSRSGLVSIPVEMFQGLTNLNSLNLEDNHLTELHPDTFKDLVELRVLSLEGCGLLALPVGIFASLTKLATLWINNNALSVLPVDLFPKPCILTMLDLSSNKFTFEDDSINALSHLNFLSVLHVDNNSLSSFPFGWTKDKPYLSLINLTANIFSYIDMNDLPLISGASRDKVINLKQLGFIPDNVYDLPTLLTDLFPNSKIPYDQINVEAVKVGDLFGREMVLEYGTSRILEVRFVSSLLGTVTGLLTGALPIRFDLADQSAFCRTYNQLPTQLLNILITPCGGSGGIVGSLTSTVTGTVGGVLSGGGLLSGSSSKPSGGGLFGRIG